MPWGPSAGTIEVNELDWYNEQHREDAAKLGRFDYLLAADCVYNEEHLEALRDTCLALMDAKSLRESHILLPKLHSIDLRHALFA